MDNKVSDSRKRPRGADKIRTMKTQGGRCVPRSQTDSYLDLFVLHKEKERLEQELAEILRRRDKTVGRLEEVMARIAKLGEAQEARQQEKEQRLAEQASGHKNWKVMSVKY